MSALVEKLEYIVGKANCLSGDDERRKYDSDITREYQGRSLAVVRPANALEVSEIVRLANETHTTVVPLSGNTGLAGGGFPGLNEDTIILSLERMNAIREIKTDSRIAIVEAGVVLANLHEAVEDHGLIFPLLFGARGSCMIGGNLATNAGGSNVVRYGNTRALCLGIEVVTPNGAIVNLMSELHKDNTGYDLKDLFIGSEGTLGVITAAVLKLFPKPKAHAAAMVSVPDIASALTLLHKIQSVSGGGVEAFEYMPKIYFEHLSKLDPDAPMPFVEPAETGVFVEIVAVVDKDAETGFDGSVPVQDLLTETLAELMESGEVLDATIAQSEAHRMEMWRQRELAFEVANYRGIPISADVAVPLDKVSMFIDTARNRLTEILPDVEILPIAHLGDGNLHYAVWANSTEPGPAEPDVSAAIYKSIEDVVEELHGSFSAEHGIGLSKRGSMSRRKDPAALVVMRAIKTALDPNNIMNPGKIFP